ncbi:MAG: hypothetical protein HPZ91_03265 [Lentisphaeria bacterium]|nr:hypothetical protein [Lentisphaeria bacterium]
MKPAGDILLQTSTNQSTLIQTVSGMAGDVFDSYDVSGYQQLGVGVDITDEANRRGFGLGDTYPGMSGLLTGPDGRQYAYPCNATSLSLWINLTTLERYGFGRPDSGSV